MHAAVAVDANDRVVVAGYTQTASDRDLALARYLGDSTSTRRSRRTGRSRCRSAPGDDEAAAIAISPTARSSSPATPPTVASTTSLIARFLDSGNLDPASAEAPGTVRVAFGTGRAFGNAVALQN